MRIFLRNTTFSTIFCDTSCKKCYDFLINNLLDWFLAYSYWPGIGVSISLFTSLKMLIRSKVISK